MCGIIGTLAFGKLNKKQEKARQNAMIFFATELMAITQARGKDATGISTLFDDGNYTLLKMGIPSPEFISRYGGTEKDFDGFIKIWRENDVAVRTCIAHCRKSSVGNSYDNANNHPIKVDDVIGIHNGTLNNHDIIFDKLNCKRDGSVDSEAIFRLVSHFSNNGKNPLTLDMLKQITARLEGTYSCIFFSGNNPYQVGVFRDTRPMEMVLIRPLNMVVIASEKKFLNMVLYRYNKLANIYCPDMGLPELKTKDLEFEDLNGDSHGIFDLTTKITEKTKIDDLFEHERIIAADKLWKEKDNDINTVYKGNRTKTVAERNREDAEKRRKEREEAEAKEKAEKEAKGTTKTEVDAKPSSSSSKRKGMVFNKKLKRYQVSGDVEATDGIGAVEIDTENGKATEVNNKKQDEDISADIGISLEEEKVGKDVEDLVANPAAINNVTIEEDTDLELEGSGKIVEKDMVVDTKALEEAEELVKALKSYKTDEDVLNDLEITDIATLEKMSPLALANKIRKYAAKYGFQEGWKKNKAEIITKTVQASDDNKEMCSSDSKAARAEENIRILKVMFKIIERIVEKNPSIQRVQYIEDAVAETFRRKENISHEAITNIFSVGDMKSNQIIKDIARIVSNKEARD